MSRDINDLCDKSVKQMRVDAGEKFGKVVENR